MTRDIVEEGSMMRVQPTSDPLGAAANVTIPLPEPESDHFAPCDELTALHQVGLGFASAVFIDEPTSDIRRWPSADAAFLQAIVDSDPESILTPLVWARIRTAPRYPSVRQVNDEWLPALTERQVPRDPEWPADFSGVPTGSLTTSLEEHPGSRLVLHIPPGDGWHRVAWVQQDVEGISMWSLMCECSLQHVVTSGGGIRSFSGPSDCAYRPVAAYLRALSFQGRFPEATPHTLREMVDVALAGTWLGQRNGDQLWGSHLYLQTVSAVLDVPMPWELASEAVEAGLVSLDGAVVGPPRPARTAPPGPVMNWDSTDETDGDWVVWWARLNGRYQVEVTRDPKDTSHATLTIYDHTNNDTMVHNEHVGLAYGAVFGPDASDVGTWQERAAQIVEEPH
ncbi:MAG TPA: hypothetical protein H9759_06475 [Candidatus Dietzia intestinipullorum]|nr:hypothetical protein [Candidatus Dietzia intestinipullorum]